MGTLVQWAIKHYPDDPSPLSRSVSCLYPMLGLNSPVLLAYTDRKELLRLPGVGGKAIYLKLF